MVHVGTWFMVWYRFLHDMLHGLCMVMYKFWCIVDERFGTVVGALLMHDLV
jgi:hypothetical protein